MAVADDVVLIAPEFTGDANLSAYISLAADLMDPQPWGTLYGKAVAYLTAHIMTMAADGAAGGGGAAGAVASRKAGDVAISYHGSVMLPAADAWLGLSQYGLTFLAIRSMLSVTGPRLVGPVQA